MLDTMRPLYALRSLVIALAMGLWAGGAAAQGEETGGWFEESDRAERPLLEIHGTGGPYDPPPADFESDPAPAYTTDSADADAEDTVVTEEDAEAQRRALREFSPHLAPYGHWVDDPFYGRVWVPTRSAVGVGFSPYVSAGHWELTRDDEWLWVSDYPFGWITFHYGRWVWISDRDWAWVPGYHYSPAWVDFRIGSAGYVGWGPSVPYRAWRGGVFVSIGVRRPLPYIFCPTTYVFSHSVHRHVIRDRHRVRSIAAQTYRYRPHRVSSWTRVARGPGVVEARIPSRALPTRRAIARPRFIDAQSNLTQSNLTQSKVMSSGSRSLRRDAAPRANRQYQRSSATDPRASSGRVQRARGAPSTIPGRARPEVRGRGATEWAERMPAASPQRRAPAREAASAPDYSARPAKSRDPLPAARGSRGERRSEARGTRGSANGRSQQRVRAREIQGPQR